jgi:hypothetical protein
MELDIPTCQSLNWRSHWINCHAIAPNYADKFPLRRIAEVRLGSSRHVNWINCHAIALYPLHKFPLRTERLRNIQCDALLTTLKKSPGEEMGKWVWEALAMLDRTGSIAMRSLF